MAKYLCFSSVRWFVVHDMDDGEKLYTSERHWFVVRRVSGGLIIQAVCGTVGLTLRSRMLTAEETAAFYEDPEQLASVARELCDR
jgi:hypothetical protein